MPHHAPLLGARRLAVVTLIGAVLAQTGPEELMPRHSTDSVLASPRARSSR